MPLSDFLIAVGVIFIWALNTIVIKVGVTEIPPLEMTVLRFILVGVLLLPFMRVNRRQLKWLLLLSFTFGLMHFSLMFLGLSMSEAGTAALLVQLGTPFATILAAIFLKERLNAKRIFGLAVSFSGVIVLAGGPSLPSALPLCLLLLSAMGWAVSNLLIKIGPPIPSLAMAGWVSLLAIPQVALASLIFESGQWEAILNAGWRGWTAVIYSAVLSSILAYGLWYSLLRRHVMAKLVPMTLLTPVFAVILGVLLLGDDLGVFKLAGGALVISGIGIINVRWRDLLRPKRAKERRRLAAQQAALELERRRLEGSEKDDA
ncbi:DMT family transporter [Halotalea alkalilenta]|uniref:DMT family transporter n=1 Tax=Halotalea alkalilenta TaxID=376489 RepID=UPI0007D08E32|nr:EamA family transporter [Halotalea alkalilenta]